MKSFLTSGIVILAITAFLKMISAGGESPILEEHDYVLFPLTKRELLVSVAVAESGIAGLLCCRSISLGCSDNSDFVLLYTGLHSGGWMHREDASAQDF